MTPQLLDSHTEIATTGHGMFGFYDEEGTHPEPSPRHDDQWHTASRSVLRFGPGGQLGLAACVQQQPHGAVSQLGQRYPPVPDELRKDAQGVSRLDAGPKTDP
ncbi:hypothetical protein [Actinomadura kijaniata]|uniref:hypothetical protein n=1 Tax=Actinomadura kijaniata TaxID=46161 RepID=UPI00083782D6|nr:hypothetical protein [Actinomadura kijaniata]